MADLLRRVLAILLTLSVQWSTLGGAYACAATGRGEATADAMAGMAGMRHVAGSRAEGEPGSAVGHVQGKNGAVPALACCASEALPSPDGQDIPGDRCVLMATCAIHMLATGMSPTMDEVGLVAPKYAVDAVAPPTRVAPPDVPPPKA